MLIDGDSRRRPFERTRIGADPHRIAAARSLSPVAVWTPTRESASTLAFMATLRLHSSSWHWVDLPGQARWWIVDAAACADLPALLDRYDELDEKPSVAFLCGQMSELPRPAWTFFKPPVKSGLIFSWIRPQVGPTTQAPAAALLLDAEAAPAPWHQGLLRLRRWPNIGRYGNTLELTVACSRLLTAPVAYREVLQWSVPAPLLDRLLADAHREGLLQIIPRVEEPPAPAQAMPTATIIGEAAAGGAIASTAAAAAPALTSATISRGPGAGVEAGTAAAEPSRWDLIKRLLGRFSRR